MFEVLVAFVILLSALLAIYYKEIIYSIVSMTIVFLAISSLYFYLGAFYAAVFQLAAGLGTGIVFLLIGRTLIPLSRPQPVLKKTIAGFVALMIFLISVLVEVRQPGIKVLPVVQTVPVALWNVRVLDVLAQSLVVLTVALGVGIILAEEESE